MEVSQYWPLDVFVALLFAALGLFTAFRAVRKLRVVLHERRILREQLRQLAANHTATAHAVPAQHPAFTSAMLADNPSFMTVHRSSPPDGDGKTSATPLGDRQLGLPSLLHDKRSGTVGLLLLVTVYCISRTVMMLLGAFATIPLDGSLDSHLITTLPAALYMALQTTLIARWARHVRDSEMRLYARDFKIAWVAVWISAALDASLIVVTVTALICVAKGDSHMSAESWNMVTAGTAGSIYCANGVIFIALGLRLFWTWTTSRDPMRYEAVIEAQQQQLPTASRQRLLGSRAQADQLPIVRGGSAWRLSDASDTAGCTRNGSRGQRILGVAFGFGFVCVLRGVGLLAFVLQHHQHFHNIVHNGAAPAGALLLEFCGLVVTLRLLMPPGTSEGDGDPQFAAASDTSQYTTSNVTDFGANPSGRLLDESSRATSVAASAAGYGSNENLSSMREARRKHAEPAAQSRHHQHQIRRPQRTAWAGAHNLESYEENERGDRPSSSWHLADGEDTEVTTTYDYR